MEIILQDSESNIVNNELFEKRAQTVLEKIENTNTLNIYDVMGLEELNKGFITNKINIKEFSKYDSELNVTMVRDEVNKFFKAYAAPTYTTDEAYKIANDIHDVNSKIVKYFKKFSEYNEQDIDIFIRANTQFVISNDEEEDRLVCETELLKLTLRDIKKYGYYQDFNCRLSYDDADEHYFIHDVINSPLLSIILNQQLKRCRDVFVIEHIEDLENLTVKDFLTKLINPGVVETFAQFQKGIKQYELDNFAYTSKNVREIFGITTNEEYEAFRLSDFINTLFKLIGVSDLDEYKKEVKKILLINKWFIHLANKAIVL